MLSSHHTPRFNTCSISKITRVLRGFLLFVFLCGALVTPVKNADARPLFAPTPSVGLGVPSAPFIGDSLTITATFSNSETTGYGPYIDLYLPLSGADGTSGSAPNNVNDGISFVSVNYIGTSVTTTVLNCPAGTNVTHPLTSVVRS